MKQETIDIANSIIADQVTANDLLNAFPSGAVTVEPETIRALMVIFDEKRLSDEDINNALTVKYNAFYFDIKSILTTAQETLTTKLSDLQDAPDPEPPPEG